jgi:hypothetical protein
MDVFVIPVGRDRYELYCEPSSDAEAEEAVPPPAGVVGRLRHRFGVMLRAAEERQHARGKTEPAAADDQEGPFYTRLQDRVFEWAARRIAEQRLLWNLRRQATAVAVHPPDMSFDQVLTLIRRTLQRDYDRHRRWLIVDGIAFLLTFILLGPLFLLIPGVANIPALYFGFRAVGHYLSMRGATHGLNGVRWTGKPCPPLTELREVVLLEPVTRDARLHDISERLRLQHLSTFFERVAIRHA